MNILVISSDYPDRYHNGAAFVQQLVDEFARQGHSCLVISPHSITASRRLSQGREIIKIGKGNVIIERPNYFSLSSLKVFGIELSAFFRKKIINNVLEKLSFNPDVVYTHFWRCGFEGYEYAKTHNIPLFVASGESVITMPPLGREDLTPFYEYVKGVVCVSTKNKNESIALGMTNEDKCIVLPNAVNHNLFRKEVKMECRRSLGIPEDVFVTISLGWFSQRKGQTRVVQAVESLKDSLIKTIFIGGGEDRPVGNSIIYVGQVMHDNVPTYLNAADVYVLPTRAEGCCNSIVEAMACGLPIISSNLPFNFDICNTSNSILVSPDDIEGIASAIKRLKDDDALRMKLSEGSLNTAKGLTLEKRAQSIISFMIAKINEENVL